MEATNLNHRLSFLLVGYLVSFPVALGLISKRFIFSDIFLILIIISGLVECLRSKQLKVISLDILFLVFSAISLVGVYVTSHLSAYTFELSAMAFSYVGARNIAAKITSPDMLELFLKTMGKVFQLFIIFFGIVICARLFGFVEITEPFYLSGRFKGLFNFTNQLGIFLVCLMPLAIMDKFDKPVARFSLYGIFFLILSSIASRSCFWVGVVQTILVEIFVPERKKAWLATFRYVALALIFFLVISIMATQPSLQRSLGNDSYKPLTFDSERMKNFREAFNASEYWLRGYGLGCFRQRNTYEVHNSAFSVLVETGVIGFIVFMVFCISILTRAYKAGDFTNAPDFRRALFLSLFGIISLSMLHNLLRTRSCWLVLTIVLCFLSLQSKNRDERC